IPKMIFAIRGFAAVSIAAKIGGNHGIFLGQLGSNLPPFNVRFRIAVEQQKSGPTSGGNKVDRGARSFPAEFFEPWKKVGIRRFLICLLRDAACPSEHTASGSHRANA